MILPGGVNFTADADSGLFAISLGSGNWYIPFLSRGNGMPIGIPYNYILLQDQQTSGTQGGTFSSGSWITRVLNTEVTDTGGYCTLSSNQFTLAAGTYEIFARAPGVACDSHKARLQNITDGSTTLLGSSAYSNASSTVMSDSLLNGRFTITSSKTFELQHRCSSTRATQGLGQSSAFGVSEIYAQVELRKVA